MYIKVVFFIEKIIDKIICKYLKRHTEEYMLENRRSLHNFYGIDKRSYQCICPICGYSKIIKEVK